VLAFADFYALMPPDNSATVAPGTDVSFPQDGPNSTSDITRVGPDSFSLGEIGTYHVLFEVSATEAGQLLLTLNGEDLPYTGCWPCNRKLTNCRHGACANYCGRLCFNRTQPRRNGRSLDDHTFGRWDTAGFGASCDHEKRIII